MDIVDTVSTGIGTFIPVVINSHRFNEEVPQTVTGDDLTAVPQSSRALEEALDRQSVDVVCIPIERFTDVVPQVRYEGDTMIVPVVEDVMVVVVEKRLWIAEEVRVSPHIDE